MEWNLHETVAHLYGLTGAGFESIKCAQKEIGILMTPTREPHLLYRVRTVMIRHVYIESLAKDVLMRPVGFPETFAGLLRQDISAMQLLKYPWIQPLKYPGIQQLKYRKLLKYLGC